jgi:hypothetical protein
VVCILTCRVCRYTRVALKLAGGEKCRYTRVALKLAGGEKCMLLFLKQTLPGNGFSVVGNREVFHGLGVQDVTEFDSV